MHTFRSARPQPIVVAVILMSLSGLGCQTWHVESISPESLFTRHPARLRVVKTDSSNTVLEHPVLHADTLSGMVSDDQWANIPLANVRQLETARANPGGTLAFLFGLVTVGYGLLILAYYISCSGGACN